MLDIDKFKNINDTYGHETGDLVIKMVANSLQKVFDDDREFFGRIGGKEFCVVCKSSKEAAVAKSEKIRSVIEQQRVTDSDGNKLHCTVSCGIAHREPAHKSFDETLNAADENLYEAKEGGRNRVVFRSRPR